MTIETIQQANEIGGAAIGVLIDNTKGRDAELPEGYVRLDRSVQPAQVLDVYDSLSEALAVYERFAQSTQ